MRAATLSLLAALAAGTGSCSRAAPAAQAPAPAAEPSPADPVQLASFDAVWNTVRERHWDLDLAAWQAARDQLRPRALEASDAAALRPILDELLAILGQSHFGIIPAEGYQALEAEGNAAPEDQGDGTVGIDLRILGDHAVVVRVDEGSSAAAAGVQPGWVVVRVRDEAVEDILRTVGEALPASSMREVSLTRAVAGRLTGAVGSEVPVVLRDGDDREHSLSLARAEPRGEVARFGHLPALRVSYDSDLRGDAGYVALSAFFDPGRIMPAFAADLARFREAGARGLVLDLRGNPGGIGAMAMGIGGHLVSEADQSLGTMISKEGELRFVLSPQPRPFTGKVAILVDGLSGSTSEILAGGLQDLGRARVFGSRTAGAALPSSIEKLPNGDGFQFAVANYVSADGEALEGSGVEPDQRVLLTRAALLTGSDPILDAALTWIRSDEAPR